MEIKWPNVVTFVLVTAGVVLAVWQRNTLGIAVAGLGHIGPGHTPEEKFHGFLVLGILAVVFVAVVRLVLNSQEGGKDR